jgi:transketolase
MSAPSDPRHLAANAIRALAIDAINAANSGHPGAPMGMADIATVLWTQVMRFDPSQPDWPDRDRFVLSNGHASMLLYACLHLSGYALSMDELRRFRQLHSKTPGHPEYGLTPGVETTTGPLGQGFSNGIGMAIAARMKKARFSAADGFAPVSHHVFGVCGDGCLMEGITAEAASLAGHLGLGEIVYLYDDNKITIDGATSITFTEDVGARFVAYGWHVQRCDGHDQDALLAAIEAAKAETSRPSLILARTRIGYGSPNREGTSGVHGAPLGAEEAAATKARLGWDHPPFEVPAEARAPFEAAAARGRAAREAWDAAMAERRAKDASFGAAWDALHAAPPDDLWETALASVTPPAKAATRALGGKVVNAIAKAMPSFIGGSADLAESNKTELHGMGFVQREDASGRNLCFGVREHAMGAIVNGIALYGGFVPFGATFLTFSDYMRPALRLAALMKLRSITVFTHDSVYLGEDGPTHQSVEHAWALRLIPGLHLWRPADGLETALAWAWAVGQGEPAPHTLLLTRQALPPLDRPDGFQPTDVWKGAYVVREAAEPNVILVGTGSEVHVAVGAAERLAERGIAARVVSMPCRERFLAQDEAARAALLPAGVPKVAVELGRTTPWASIIGDGLALGVDGFGESAPWEVLREHYGMTPEAVAERVAAWLATRA